MKQPHELTTDQQDWLDKMSTPDRLQAAGLVRIITSKGKLNPCVALYGPGPADKRCKHCAHLRCHRFSKNYFKCALRGDTHGPATDHRVNWPTCGKFQPK